MPALGEHSKVYNTALLVLQRKGFRVWYDEATELYDAEKGAWDFMSPSPIGLLGLVAIYDYKQPQSFSEYWWREQRADVYRTLPTSPPKYTPVWSRTRSRKNRREADET